jgi:hypothetical protein
MHAECRSRGEIGVALRVASTAIRCRAASPYVPRPRLLHNRRRSRHRYPLVSSRWSKKLIYASRDAFALGCAMISGDRIRDPMPSGMLAPFPYTMRGRSDRCSASALPVLTGGAGGQNEFKCIVNIVASRRTSKGDRLSPRRPLPPAAAASAHSNCVLDFAPPLKKGFGADEMDR